MNAFLLITSPLLVAIPVFRTWKICCTSSRIRDLAAGENQQIRIKYKDVTSLAEHM